VSDDGLVQWLALLHPPARGNFPGDLLHFHTRDQNLYPPTATWGHDILGVCVGQSVSEMDCCGFRGVACANVILFFGSRRVAVAFQKPGGLWSK
jgi:hypothetical protein